MIVLTVKLIIPIKKPKMAPIRGPYMILAMMTGIWTMVGLIGNGKTLKTIELSR